MRILFISNDLVAGNLAWLMTKEGHDVKMFVQEKDRRRNFQNMVKQTTNWRKELDWVGKDGLIVFDDTGWGKAQDSLRKKGYKVFGGSFKGEELENNRQLGNHIFFNSGLKTAQLYNLDNLDDAISFIKRNGGAWVLKQNAHTTKTFNFKGCFSDGRDVIDVLESYKKDKRNHNQIITLQERLDGVEIGVGRYFNGHDWVGPIEINLEHKKFFPGNLGPTTSEMGTLAWYDDNENNRLYQETLAKIKPYLEKSGFIGDFEINCIVNEKGAFPLEATARFGSPIIHLHSEIHASPWGEFLSALSKGENYDLKWKRGYGIVVVLAVPPFPYTKKIPGHSFIDMNIYFDDYVKENMEHVHFEEVSKRSDSDNFYISDDRGYVLYVTSIGHTIKEARDKAYRLIDGIHIPKVIYRNDIGLKFMEEDGAKLRSWGYNL